eukprot:SAG22_NODE_516_length_9563_cov_29.476965_7_plen_203_part_00
MPGAAFGGKVSAPVRMGREGPPYLLFGWMAKTAELSRPSRPTAVRPPTNQPTNQPTNRPCCCCCTGQADIMALYDPTSSTKIPQSGTFNAAPIVMVAGLATLKAMTPEVYATLEKRAAFMAAGLEKIFADAGVVASVLAVGSIFQYFFLPKLPTNYREAAADDKAKHAYLDFAMLNKGVNWRNSLTNISVRAIGPRPVASSF